MTNVRAIAPRGAGEAFIYTTSSQSRRNMEQDTVLDFGPTLDFSRSRLGTFRIVDRLAGGGMASVYLGCRLSVRGTMELAAVKVMLPELSHDPDYVEMFFDEIRLTSAVRHPCVARVLEHGVDGVLHYLTTEYLFGESWSDLVGAFHKSDAARPILEPLLVSILIQVCDALHAVHETSDDNGKPLSIVHRDVCPNNLIVCYDGSVKLVDFGIATACERLHQTRDGILKGHVGYMAPEQVRGLKVDRRCDVWAIGVMLWEGLTGRRLFKRDSSRATIHAVATEPLEPILSLAELIPASLRPVITQALDRDPARRFATAQQMGDALRATCRPSELLSQEEIAAWMQRIFEDRFAHRRTELKRKVARLVDRAETGGPVQSAVVRIEEARARPPEGRAAGQLSGRATNDARHGVLAAARSVGRAAKRSMAMPHRVAIAVLVAGALGWLCIPRTDIEASERERSARAWAATSAPPSKLSVRAQDTEAIVELSGRILGKTPLTVDVPPGRHVARVRPSAGGEPAVTEIELASGERYELLVERGTPR